jgi:hypothetical protein
LLVSASRPTDLFRDGADPVKQTSRYCDTCGKQTLHTKETPNHILHLLLSIVTLGLWLIVWVAVTIVNSGKRPRCVVCGST